MVKNKKLKYTQGKYFMDPVTSGVTNNAFNNLSVVTIDHLNKRENALSDLEPSQLRIKDIF